MTTVEKILMRRDGYTREEAREALKEARQRVLDGEDPEEILHEDFGLEPDYVFDLMFWVPDFLPPRGQEAPCLDQSLIAAAYPRWGIRKDT